MFGSGVWKMTENTNTTSNVTTCDCYNRGREDMRNAVINILDHSQSRSLGLEPLTDDSVASQGILNERTPNAN